MDKYLQSLLLEIKTLIFPGLGAITITNEKSGELMFMSYLKFDDGKLAKCMAEKEGMTELDAKNVVGKYVQNIIQTLDRGEKYSMYQFGEFHKDASGEVQFKAWNTGEDVVSSFEGEIINLNEIQPELLADAETLPASRHEIVKPTLVETSISEKPIEETTAQRNEELQIEDEVSPTIEFGLPTREIDDNKLREITESVETGIEEQKIPEIELEIVTPNVEEVVEQVEIQKETIENEAIAKEIIEEDKPLFDTKISTPVVNSLDDMLNNTATATNQPSSLDDLLGTIEIEKEVIEQIKDIPFEIENIVNEPISSDIEAQPIEEVAQKQNDVHTSEEIISAEAPEILAQQEQTLVSIKEVQSENVIVAGTNQGEKSFDEEYQEKLKVNQGQITVIAPRKKKKWIYFVAPVLLLLTLYLIGFTKFKTLSKSFPIMEKYAFIFGQKTTPDTVKAEPIIKNEEATELLNQDQIETPDEEISSTPVENNSNGNMESNGNNGDTGTPAYEESKPVKKEEKKIPADNTTSSSTGGAYCIVIGSFGNEDNAKRLAKKINGEVIGTTSGGLHMVSAASFNSKSEAKAALSGIQADHTGAHVVKRP
jgi:nucleoid DNA-binding protein/cell division septation protein DedD